ncbi:Lar family restriction alleviation protein [Methanomassiliicoccales archaeon LGM-RCC1]|nr:Lar family restriction alleviation protein [Methanomassiliicoccales archaeon LGM-RCC1]
MTDLKPCPFCGQTAYLHLEDKFGIDGERLSYVSCYTCLVQGPLEMKIEKAIESWNRRADDDADLLALFNGWLDSERYNCDNSEHD